MGNVKSIGALLGTEKKAGKAKREAVGGLFRADFKGAPEWFLSKYFEAESGSACGRMRVRLYDKLGAIVTKGGIPVFTKMGRPQRLTTAYLAKLVEEDLEKVGKPMKVHFKGYSLDPERFVLENAYAQEEYEENERRHVPGLDEDDIREAQNGAAPLDRQTWESCACFAMNALRTHTLMYWGLDEDFARVILAADFVHASYNAYLRELWARICSLTSPKTLRFVSERNDFSMFDAEDVIRTYMRAMRALTGKEYGESMLEDAWLLDPDMDMDYVAKCAESAKEGWLNPGNASCKEEMAALILANLDPTDEAPQWELDEERELWDDDTGDMATGLLLKY